MPGTKSLRLKSIGRWTTSKGEEEKRAPWWGYDELSGAGWYLYTLLKSEQQLDALTFPSTTIDYNSQRRELQHKQSQCTCCTNESGEGDKVSRSLSFWYNRLGPSVLVTSPCGGPG